MVGNSGTWSHDRRGRPFPDAELSNRRTDTGREDPPGGSQSGRGRTDPKHAAQSDTGLGRGPRPYSRGQDRSVSHSDQPSRSPLPSARVAYTDGKLAMQLHASLQVDREQACIFDMMALLCDTSLHVSLAMTGICGVLILQFHAPRWHNSTASRRCRLFLCTRLSAFPSRPGLKQPIDPNSHNGSCALCGQIPPGVWPLLAIVGG